MKVVHVAQDPMNAHLIAGFLMSRGVQAFVGNEAIFGVLGEVGFGSGSKPTVSVADGDYVKAKQLLGEDLPGGACRR